MEEDPWISGDYQLMFMAFPDTPWMLQWAQSLFAGKFQGSFAEFQGQSKMFRVCSDHYRGRSDTHLAAFWFSTAPSQPMIASGARV